MRLVSWNIENLAPYLGASAKHPLSAALEACGTPDVFCLQEVRIRRSDTELAAVARAALPGYDCHLSLCDDPENVRFRGGRMYGVATYVRATLGARPHPCEWDREGRIVTTELPGLALVNVYAVNGTDKPWFDHELGRIAGDRHAWKQRFIERVEEEGRAWRARGVELVLLGDWNVSRSRLDTHPRLRTEEPHATARARFDAELLPGLDVADAFRELHPTAREYTWFRRGARWLDAARVDFALVSRSLLPSVREAGILAAPEARFSSDHAPLWLTLERPSP